MLILLVLGECGQDGIHIPFRQLGHLKAAYVNHGIYQAALSLSYQTTVHIYGTPFSPDFYATV